MKDHAKIELTDIVFKREDVLSFKMQILYIIPQSSGVKGLNSITIQIGIMKMNFITN